MNIDKLHAKTVFDDYVNNYDLNDEMIKLKAEHTYRVADLCENIASRIGLKQKDRDIAWLLGLLHDIGRFEQVKRYGTFNDSKSIDHAELGVKILFEDNMIRDFISDNNEDELIEKAIACHNAYEVPENYSKRILSFSNILRDADKIDIFKVNTIIPPEYIYGVSSDELYTSSITKEVFENFMRKETILRKLKRSAVDHIVGHISLVFGLVYKESVETAQQMGCLEKLMEFKSQNDTTNEQFKEIQNLVHEYISEKINN